jgi:hypothetical protein
VAMLAKEDISLLAVAIGVYLWVFRRERRPGLIIASAGLLWFFVCTALILPSFNGLGGSPFLHRLAIFGPTLRESIASFLRQPGLLWDWLRRPEIVSYLGGLLASAGFMSLLSPVVLGLASPLLAINIFSTWPWTYSEGAHYSVTIIPFIIVSAIYGFGKIRDFLAARLKSPNSRITAALAVLVLAITLAHHHQIGVSPIAKVFQPPQITAHDQLGAEIVKLLPDDASVSAQSNLYPHVAHREKAYFFPAVNDADYVFLDATSTTYPLDAWGFYFATQQLLQSGQYSAVVARDGYLLLKRGAESDGYSGLPESFYTFARAGENPASLPVNIRFGDTLELVGYEYSIRDSVQGQTLPTTITTYWRVLAPSEVNYRFSFFFTREDGAIVFLYNEGTPTTYWYPPYQWPADVVIRMEVPELNPGRGQGVLLAVSAPGQDPWRADNRLRPEPGEGQNVELLDGGTLVKLFTLPR